MLNKHQIIGNLGADPEVRYTQAGDAVANFNVATTEKWKDKEGNPQEQTEWHRCVAFKRTGEICGEYLTKGSKVYIEGRSQTRQWEDKDGNKRYTTEIVVRDMKMLDTKNGGGSSGGYDGEEPPMPEPSGQDDVPF